MRGDFLRRLRKSEAVDAAVKRNFSAAHSENFLQKKFAENKCELPFTDKIDFKGVVKALKDINYKGYFTLEADSYLKKEDDEKTIFEKVKNMASVAKRIEDEFLRK